MINKQNFKSLNKFVIRHKIKILLSLIYLLAVLVRVWFVKDGAFAFGYDQARDAVHAGEILNGHLKLFGPTASGTQDTIFHGVIYYYLLAGLHLLSNNPVIIGVLLGIISALSVVPIFYLTKSITRNNITSLYAALLAALSYEQITAGTWLSNPAPVIFILPCFIYFFHRLTYNLTVKNMILATFLLGLATQLLFFEIYWGLSLLIFFFYDLWKNKWKLEFEKIKIWAIGTLVFIVTISSMLLVEFLMIKRGILDVQALTNFDQGTAGSLLGLIKSIYDLWMRKIDSSLSKMGSLVIVWGGWLLSDKQFKRRVAGLKISLITPVIFLLMYFRNNHHMLIGYESLLYVVVGIILADVFTKRDSQLVKKGLSVLVLVFFAYFNLNRLNEVKQTSDNPTSVQKGFVYQDQIDLIHKTYQLADGHDFSIATLTNPYKINVTWGYLYDYVSRRKYGYKPTFYGSDQVGLVGSDLLTRVEQPEEVHFAIIEPDIGLDPMYYRQFIADQEAKKGPVFAKINFNELQLLQFNQD